jgi:hypothetical protein
MADLKMRRASDAPKKRERKDKKQKTPQNEVVLTKRSQRNT